MSRTTLTQTRDTRETTFSPPSGRGGRARRRPLTAHSHRSSLKWSVCTEPCTSELWASQPQIYFPPRERRGCHRSRAGRYSRVHCSPPQHTHTRAQMPAFSCHHTNDSTSLVDLVDLRPSNCNNANTRGKGHLTGLCMIWTVTAYQASFCA